MKDDLDRIYQTHVQGKQTLPLAHLSSGPEFVPQFQRDPESLKFEQNCLSQLINISKEDDIEKNIQPVNNSSTETIKRYSFEDALRELKEFEDNLNKLKSSS
jgi:hypothetical protein